MSQDILGVNVTNSPEYQELLQKYTNLKEEMDRYKMQTALLETAEHERDMLLSDLEELRMQIKPLEADLEYARLEMSRAKAEVQQEREKVKQLELFEASVLAICAVSHDQLAPYSKLALITAQKQTPYSAALHGGPAEVMLTSMKQWNKAIGGNEDNTNCLNKALKPLEDSGTVKRALFDCRDGKKHYIVETNEQHLRHPRLIAPEKVRPHNGGDKRKCPHCQQPLKPNVSVTYECVKCGVDFDRDMNPIDHKPSLMIVAPLEEEVKPAAAQQQAFPDDLNIIQFPQTQMNEWGQYVLSEAELSVFEPTKKKRG